MLPRISIVTPCFNAEAYIEEAIDSVLGQGYPNLEYIIADGGSTDRTPAIIGKYARHLAAVLTGPDGGPYDAINRAFAISSGEVMAWLNADDLYLKNALHSVGQIMAAEPGVAWISSRHHMRCTADGTLLSPRTHAGFAREAFLDGHYWPSPANSLYRASIQQESTFWRRWLWQRAGGALSLDYRLAADFALWAEFYRHADLVAVDLPLAVFRQHRDNRSRNCDGLYTMEALVALERLRLHCAYHAPAGSGFRVYQGRILESALPDGEDWHLLDYRFGLVGDEPGELAELVRQTIAG